MCDSSVLNSMLIHALRERMGRRNLGNGIWMSPIAFEEGKSAPFDMISTALSVFNDLSVNSARKRSCSATFPFVFRRDASRSLSSVGEIAVVTIEIKV